MLSLILYITSATICEFVKIKRQIDVAKESKQGGVREMLTQAQNVRNARFFVDVFVFSFVGFTLELID